MTNMPSNLFPPSTLMQSDNYYRFYFMAHWRPRPAAEWRASMTGRNPRNSTPIHGNLIGVAVACTPDNRSQSIGYYVTLCALLGSYTLCSSGRGWADASVCSTTYNSKSFAHSAQQAHVWWASNVIMIYIQTRAKLQPAGVYQRMTPTLCSSFLFAHLNGIVNFGRGVGGWIAAKTHS